MLLFALFIFFSRLNKYLQLLQSLSPVLRFYYPCCPFLKLLKTISQTNSYSMCPELNTVVEEIQKNLDLSKVGSKIWTQVNRKKNYKSSYLKKKLQSLDSILNTSLLKHF